MPEAAEPGVLGRVPPHGIYGTGSMGNPAIDNTPEEAIVNRLVKLLAHLDRTHPGDGWGGFLDNGPPGWGRIAVSGQSQGAGMAAFIAKEQVVARVILFSSPWDYVERGPQRELAPWLAVPSRTPPERWFGGYHARGDNPFHGQGIANPAYAEERAFFLRAPVP